MSESYFSFLDEQFEDSRPNVLLPALTGVFAGIGAYNTAIQVYATQVARQGLIWSLAVIPLFLLYLGFFLSLRIAICTILEALAQQMPEADVSEH